MRHLNRSIRFPFHVIIITLFISFIIPSSAFSYDLPGWYHGASGYEDALSASKKNETPIILFFYIESEELCQKLRDNYLRIFDVYSFLDDVLLGFIKMPPVEKQLSFQSVNTHQGQV